MSPEAMTGIGGIIIALMVKMRKAGKL